ncbi:dodecin domain-containing protein [bacterium]|nr:dodecin domain-containing protein [bacterium]
MSDSVYKKVILIGSSPISWEEAAKNAISQAGGSLKDLRVAEVIRKDIKIDDIGDAIFRINLAISFKIVDH